jgi:hypothetical protein
MTIIAPKIQIYNILLVPITYIYTPKNASILPQHAQRLRVNAALTQRAIQEHTINRTFSHDALTLR